jgi:alpha-N-arabinofuranosidase
MPGKIAPMNTPRIALTAMTALAASLFASTSFAGTLEVAATLQADQPGPVIEKEIYGQFAEHLGRGIYGGIWVGKESKIPNTEGYRTDVLQALKNLNVPTIRWPGGCFADEYHWKDGIGPQSSRPSMINTNWGGTLEDNSFGTHEFMRLCEILGAEPYICGNLGSGTPQEMMEWVEYMTSDGSSPMANLRRANGRNEPWKVKFFAVGNENWGCGGSMTPEFYSDNYRRYNTFLKNYGSNRLVRVACGPSSSDYNWTKVLMDRIAGSTDAISLHHYTLPTGDWGHKGAATGFNESEWFVTLKSTLFMDELVSRHSDLMDKVDPKKRIGLYVDEWGTWYDSEPGTNPGHLEQQNSLRDAMVAGLNLHIFHAHADRVKMSNIAQMVNVLQAMILTNDKGIVLTPTYHVFEMYKVHQGATVLPVKLLTPDYSFEGKSIPAVSVSASRNAEGVIHVSLVNVDPHNAAAISCKLEGVDAKAVSGRVLTAEAMDAHNTFANPDVVKPTAFSGAKIANGVLTVDMPAKSIVVLELR